MINVLSLYQYCNTFRQIMIQFPKQKLSKYIVISKICLFCYQGDDNVSEELNMKNEPRIV